MNALAQVQNLTECDRSAQLEAIANSSGCEAGRVVMLDFSPVREKFGSRWNVRREAIWDHTERTIKRHLPSTAIFCRADQINYVISLPDSDSFGAQAFGFRIMEDVITHFIGSCSPADMIVKVVTGLSGDEISASPVAFRSEHLTHAQTLSTPRPPEDQPSKPTQLIRSIDGMLQQSFAFEHVYNLKIEKPIALRVSSSFLEPITRRPLKALEQAALATRQLFTADLNTIQLLDHVFGTMPLKMIIASLSMQTLTHTSSRVALLVKLNRLSYEDRARLIVEVYGLEDGLPTSRLAETTLLLKPFCRSIMARITSSRLAISNVRTARLPAVSTCATDASGNDAKLAGSLLAFGEAARGLAPTLMITDLPHKGFLSVCAASGLTHASVRSLAGLET